MQGLEVERLSVSARLLSPTIIELDRGLHRNVGEVLVKIRAEKEESVPTKSLGVVSLSEKTIDRIIESTEVGE